MQRKAVKAVLFEKKVFAPPPAGFQLEFDCKLCSKPPGASANRKEVDPLFLRPICELKNLHIRAYIDIKMVLVRCELQRKGERSRVHP